MVCCSVLLGVLVTIYLLQSRPVYLVDFFCYRAPDRYSSGQRCQQEQWRREPASANSSSITEQPVTNRASP